MSTIECKRRANDASVIIRRAALLAHQLNQIDEIGLEPRTAWGGDGRRNYEGDALETTLRQAASKARSVSLFTVLAVPSTHSAMPSELRISEVKGSPKRKGGQGR